MLFITYINGLYMMDLYSRGAYLFVVLFVLSNYLFKDANYFIKIVFLIWLITLAIAANSIIYGENIFSIGNVNLEERRMIIDNGITGSSASELGIDLNYFGSTQAIGALITLMFIQYRKYLLSICYIPFQYKRIIKNTIFQYLLYLVFVVEVWLVFRGISRGAVLVLLVGFISNLIVLRKFKYLFYGGFILIALYLIMNHLGIIDLFSERLSEDDSGTSGRTTIWIGMIGAVYFKGGLLQVIFGSGNGWPWWKFWTGNFYDNGFIPSSHNQWMSILVNFGIIGLFLFIIPIFKGIKNSIKHNNPINNIRIVLFISAFFESLSLEPLIFAHYIWFIFAFATTYTPNSRLTKLNNGSQNIGQKPVSPRSSAYYVLNNEKGKN